MVGTFLAVRDAEPSGLREQEVLEKFSRVLDRASVLYPDIVDDDFVRNLGGIFPQPVLTMDAAESDAESYAQQCRAFIGARDADRVAAPARGSRGTAAQVAASL